MEETKSGPSEAQKARQQQRELQELKLQERISQIRNTVLVLSGKGGVGKSTVAANLAVTLCAEGFQVGLLDADMHGPSVPKILNVESEPVYADGENIVPVRTGAGLRVMSIAFLARGKDEAVIWRGPLKMNVLRQLLADVEWGNLDFLIVDLPPGTGDEPLSICQLIPNAAGGIVVTTPQELSVADVRKCITFCRRLELPVLGVIENMSGFVCPHCGKRADIFGEGGGQRMAQDMDVPFLGRVPIDPVIVRACDEGHPFVEEFPDSPSTKAFLDAVEPITQLGRE
ncbi:MAG: Mrp/NBP35 family ATP-binding protein [Candidatus Brocadiae bacterium]|nr:Mrp/NBP35 family ATP-binding protein [Candidatus Brocadiia bacterium]